MTHEAVPSMPVRRLQNFAYCPRLFYLQWVEALFQESGDTASGEQAHRVVDQPSRAREDLALAENEQLRSVEVESETLGLRGVIDLVEGGTRGLEIVDYKKGMPWHDEHGQAVAKSYDAVQVQAYALLLAERGQRPARGRIYYSAAKRHVEVPLGDTELDRCRALLEEARLVAASGQCPAPLESSSRCLRCAAYPVCLPGESRFWADGSLPNGIEKLPPRPEGAEGDLIVVQDPRARVGLRGGEVVVEREGEKAIKCPLEQLRAVHLYGAVQLSAQAVHALVERAVPIALFSAAGRFIGLTQGLPASGIDARRGQYRLFEQPAARLRLSRELVRAKIHNQRTLLMRNGEAPEEAIRKMAELRDRAQEASDDEHVRGLEGAAASLYFGNFGTMLRGGGFGEWDWQGRNRRPPKDPVNALLSLGYSVLAKELTGICHATGLDPLIGFFHHPRFGRPALALDMMEEFRPLIADSVALSLLNRGELTESDFVHSTRGVFLKDDARRRFWEAWSHRMDTEVTHPEFGYRMSYRRMMDVQVRQMWRFCRGESERYFGFTTR